MSVARRWSISKLLIWIFLLVGAVLCVFPFIWMLIGTTLNPNDVISGVLMPGKEFPLNWNKAVKNYNLPQYFLNSLKIAVITVFFGVIVNALAAFGFEKYRSKARERLFSFFMLSLMLPQIAIVIPLFKEMSALKLLNTHAAIILPSIMSPFIIFFMRQNFQMFPTEIMEAARIDGASEMYIFFRIVFPSMKASFVSAGIYMFLSQWNSYLWPLMTILSEDKKTLPIAISSMMRAYTIEYGAVMVIVCISILPALLLYLTMQREFVAGLLGSVKG